MIKWPAIVLTALFFSMVSGEVRADDQPLISLGYHPSKRSAPKPKKNCIKPTLEFKAGYFFFTDSKMRKIYDEGGIDLQISGTYPIWRWLQLYASVEFLEKHGRSLYDHEKTRIWEYPFNLGLQGVVCIKSNIQYYLSIGPRFIYAHVHNDSPYVDKKLNHSGVGGFVNTGFKFLLYNHFVIDLFGEYSYKRMHFVAHKEDAYGEGAQVGGLTFGGGLGYAF